MKSVLRRLRGEALCKVPMLGQTLTLYRQGALCDLFVGLATVVLFNLPWRWIPHVGDVLQLLVAVAGFYLAAALMGARAPDGMDAEKAASRWL